MVSTRNGKYEYPEEGWSTGRMRKKGEKPEGQYEVASMIPALRMRPDTRGWGVELERFAGAGMSARGGSTAARAEVSRGAGGLNPEIIQAYKAQTQAPGQPWQVATANRKDRRKGTRADPEAIDIHDALDAASMPVELLTGKPVSEWNHKILELAATLHAKYSRAVGATEISGRDENLNKAKIPIDEWNPSEQASRIMKGMSKSMSIGGKKKSEEPKEEEFEE
jgi:hypothetical protein